MGGRHTPPPQKRPEYYVAVREKYSEYISGNELQAIPSAWEAISKKAISLLTPDVNIRKLVGFSRERMEEARKSLEIIVKVLTKRSNAMWEILLTSDEETKALVESILTDLEVRMQKSIWAPE